AERQKELDAQAAKAEPATPVAITAGETVSAEPADQAVRAPEPAAEESMAASETPIPDASAETNKTPTIQPPSSGVPVSTRSPYRAIEHDEKPAESEAGTDAQRLDEMRADAEDA